MGWRVRWTSIGFSLGTVVGVILGMADWHEKAAARITAELAETHALVAELKFGGRLRDDQIRALTAALDEAKGSGMISRIEGLRAMWLEARRAYDEQWQGVLRLYDLADTLEDDSS